MIGFDYIIQEVSNWTFWIIIAKRKSYGSITLRSIVLFDIFSHKTHGKYESYKIWYNHLVVLTYFFK